ncbi:DUF4394 domain-containing protein [Pseudonocardia sp.]|uniref:DUF4394 domain-containing protein n=1 Tax=Pseudonocardia sp. TaxID=60912 RepID=UPI003D10D52C
MIRTLRLAAVVTTLAAAAVAVAPAASAHDPDGLRAVGLAGGGTELVAFRTDGPERARVLGPFAGLDGDEFLIGIDFRPATGDLYGVGDAGGIYLVDDRTADATKVGELSVALDGSSFGLDVDPVADGLRIVSDSGQNLAQAFGDGAAPEGPTVADSPLHRAGTFALTSAPATGVVGLAYINNDTDPATGTTPGVIDTRDDRLAVLHPQEKGTIRGIGGPGTLTALTGDGGLDVYSRGDLDDDRDDDAYAAVAMGGEYRLLAVALRDSTFVDRGAFPTDVLDLAIDPRQ